MKQKHASGNAKSSPFKYPESKALKCHFEASIETNSREICTLFLDVLNSTAVVEQTKTLSKIKQRLKNEDSPKIINAITDGLNILFMVCPLRHPLQQTIKSMLLNLEETHKFADGTFQYYFNDMLCNAICNKGVPTNVLQKLSIQRKSNVIMALIDNFPPGKNFLLRMVSQVMAFFASSLAIILSSRDLECKNLESNEDLLALLKTIVATKDFMLRGSNYSTGMPSNKTLMNNLTSVLNNSLLSFDCRVSAGLALVGLYFNCESSVAELITLLQYNSLSYAKDYHCNPTSNSGYDLADKLNFEDQSIRIILLHAILCNNNKYIFETQEQLAELTNGSNIFPYKSKTILINCFLPEFSRTWNSCQTKTVLVFSFKCFRLWCEVFNKVYMNIDGSVEIIQCLFNGDGYFCKVIFPILVNAIGNMVDAVRHQALSSMKLLLKTTIVISHFTQNIMTFLFEKYLRDNLNSKNKLLLLSCLLEQNSLNLSKSNIKDIPKKLLACINDVNLIPFITDNLISLFSHLNPSQEIIDMQNNMLDEILHESSINNSSSRDVILSVLLPRIIQKHSQIKQKIMTSLIAGSHNYQFKTAIALYHMATVKQKGVLQTQRCWRDFVQVNDVRNALIATDDKVKLDALSLICQSQHIKADDTELIMLFIKYNNAISCPSIRNQMTSLIRNFMISLLKLYETQTIGHNNSTTRLIEDFFIWFKKCLLFNINQCMPYATKLTSLHLLHKILEVFMQTTYNKEGKLTFGFGLFVDISTIKSLISCLFDSYDDIKNVAGDILIEFSHLSPEGTITAKTKLLTGISNGIISTKPDEVSSAGHLTHLVVNMNTHLSINDYAIFNTELNQTELTGFKQYDFLVVLYMILKEQLKTCKELLSNNAPSFPLYGTLHCINSCLQTVSMQTLLTDLTLWKEFINSLIIACCDVNNTVMDYLSSDTPEGFVGNESEFINYDHMVKSEVDDYSKTSQQLIVCSWRSVKEVCNLFGSLSGLLKESYKFMNMELINSSDITKMIDIFRYILFNVKHVGAFEVAAEGFMLLCKTLWLSTDAAIASLPRQWIQDTAKLLSGNISTNEICETRRGAGMPQFIKAICLAQPKEYNDSCLEPFLKEILSSCHSFVSASTEEESDATKKQILRLNILRFIFLDSKLSEQCLTSIEDGIISSIDGFESNLWTIRNSSTLLFSTLVSRLFGISVSRMTTHEFFSKYPRLLDFVVLKLTISNEFISLHRVPPGLQFRFFPVLTILSKLNPSSPDDLYAAGKVEELKSLVKIYLSSKLWKVRTLAARALVSLSLSKRDTFIELKNATLDLPSQAKRGVCMNQIHGTLLYIIQYIEELRKHENQITTNDINALIDIIGHVIKCRWLIERNVCFVTTESFSVTIDHIIHLIEDQGPTSPCLSDSYQNLYEFQFISLCKFFKLHSHHSSIPLGIQNCLKTHTSILINLCLKRMKNTCAKSPKLEEIVETFTNLCQHPCTIVMDTVCDILVSSTVDVEVLPLELKDAVFKRFSMDTISVNTCHDAKLLEAVGLLRIPFPWQQSMKQQMDYSNPKQAWLHLMELSNNLPLSDRVRTSLLPLIGMTMEWSMTLNDIDNLAVIIKFLLNCSTPERDSTLRHSVAKLLHANALFTSICDWLHTTETAVAMVFWHLIIKLLQDPDDNISLTVTMAINRSDYFQKIFKSQLKVIDLVTEVQSSFVLDCLVTNVTCLPGMSTNDCHSLLLELMTSTSRLFLPLEFPGVKKQSSFVFDGSRSDANVDHMTLARTAYRMIIKNYVDDRNMWELSNRKYQNILKFSSEDLQSFNESGISKDFGDLYTFLLCQNISKENENNDIDITDIIRKIHFE